MLGTMHCRMVGHVDHSRHVRLLFFAFFGKGGQCGNGGCCRRGAWAIVSGRIGWIGDQGWDVAGMLKMSLRLTRGFCWAGTGVRGHCVKGCNVCAPSWQKSIQKSGAGMNQASGGVCCSPACNHDIGSVGYKSPIKPQKILLRAVRHRQASRKGDHVDGQTAKKMKEGY